jgi:hypothetical protein
MASLARIDDNLPRLRHARECTSIAALFQGPTGQCPLRLPNLEPGSSRSRIPG